MTKNEAIEKIRWSLTAEEPQVITPKGQSYESYVAFLSDSLLKNVIEPILVKVTSSCVVGGEFETYCKSRVWGIVRSRDSWLLTLEAEMDFALGFGSDSNDIKMHGFSSSDALGEWCT